MLILKPEKGDEPQVREMLRTFEKDATKRAEKGDAIQWITLEWDIPLGKRSLSMNALQWALLTLTCRLMNEGMPDGIAPLTPVELYNQDMGKVAPAKGIIVEASALPWLEEIGVRVKYAVPIEDTDRVMAYVVKTSSKWDTQEWHLYAEYLFNRLAMMGVPLPSEDQARVKGWWLEWQMDVEDHRIELHAEELDQAHYRELHPLCESCMTFIGMGGGHLAHIKSVGAGGNEPERAKGSEWLHLCPECHLGVQHAKGWGELKLRAPHLAGKIDRALAA